MADWDETIAERVKLDIQDSVATISLARVSQLNAFDKAMHFALRRALNKISTSALVKAVVLTGDGRAFCSGQDLAERARSFADGNRPDLGVSLKQNYNPLVRELATMNLPVIAAVNGLAFGAGAAIAIACDIVLASESAKFQFGFVNVGLGLDSGASWTLPHLVGQARALDLALTGRPVAADEALLIGLVSRVVPDSDLINTAQSIARDIASKSPAAVAAIKRQIRARAASSLEGALSNECETQTKLGEMDDYRDAVLRFVRL